MLGYDLTHLGMKEKHILKIDMSDADIICQAVDTSFVTSAWENDIRGVTNVIDIS